MVTAAARDGEGRPKAGMAYTPSSGPVWNTVPEGESLHATSADDRLFGRCVSGTFCCVAGLFRPGG